MTKAKSKTKLPPAQLPKRCVRASLACDLGDRRACGRMVKLMGDGALVEFASAVDAVTCAIEIQKSVRKHNASGPEDKWIQFRIGINVGDIIVEGEDTRDSEEAECERCGLILEPHKQKGRPSAT